MPQTNINIRVDEEVKKQFEELVSGFGLTVTTAFNVFAKAVIRERKIPFEIIADDGFYNPYNQEMLKKSIEQSNRGDVVIKTMEELEAMADE